MSQRVENIVTYFVFAFIVFMSFFGMAYPLMNPSAYSEIILHGNAIPMVQHHVEICNVVDPSALSSETACTKNETFYV